MRTFEHPARADILLGGRVYTFDTNFNTMQWSPDRFPHMVREASNTQKIYFALARRGVGIIPEQTPVMEDQPDEISGAFAFFRRAELSFTDVHDVHAYLYETYPTLKAGTSSPDPAPVYDLDTSKAQEIVDEALEHTGLAERLRQLDGAA